MKKGYLLIFILFLGCLPASAQYSRFIVELKNKNGTPHSLSNPSTFLSTKAIERRLRQAIAIDSTDLPVSPVYLANLAAVPNVTVLNASRWLNQVLIRTTDSSALQTINSFSFVKKTEAIAAMARPDLSEPVNDKFHEPIFALPDRGQVSGARGLRGTLGPTVLDYGNTYNQIHIHEGEYLHDKGFTGDGITIAILDAGFYGYSSNPAMDSVRLQGRILGTWDYVNNEASVVEDHPHGLYCFSILAANKPGELIGSAPHASYWLFRTEDAATEYPVEEQNWLVAAEFADSAGADMISSSVGYSDFDDSTFNHHYAQRDGHTTIITRAANMAFHKGMIVTNSAGNSGNLNNDYKYVICPADGDSVVAVGATDINGNIASFSSWGPNGAGLLKPDIVSVGQGTVLANTSGTASSGNGTSFSNPNICGLIACLWEAFPDFSNRAIVDAVERSANRYSNPDNRYGYGLPNFRIAYEYLSRIRELRRISNTLGNKWIKAYPNPFHGSELNIALRAPLTGTARMQLIDMMGHILEISETSVQKDQLYLIKLNNAARLASGVYYIRYTDGQNQVTIPLIRK